MVTEVKLPTRMPPPTPPFPVVEVFAALPEKVLLVMVTVPEPPGLESAIPPPSPSVVAFCVMMQLVSVRFPAPSNPALQSSAPPN